VGQLELYDYGNDGVVDGQIQATWPHDARGHVLAKLLVSPVFIGLRIIST
jgi:hypothetical protein